MVQNYVRITLRRLVRQKLHTALHLTGLALGISVCLLIGLYLRHELSFDAWHEKAKRTYRINSVWTDNGARNAHFSTPFPIAEALRTEVSGIQTVAQAHPDRDEAIVEISPQRRFKQPRILLAEPEFLDVFDVEVLRGNGHAALRKPFQALLTETTAAQYFGKEDPVGKTFRYKNEFTITVAGIIRDLPANTHLPASMLISLYRDEKFLHNDPKFWSSVSGTSAYVVLPANTDPKTLEAPLKTLADKYLNADPNLPKNFRGDFEIQPLSDVHFNHEYAGGGPWVQAVNKKWLWFFAIIGIAVLALACINFINLSTAQALTRAKEVGVRKSVGASRDQLIAQFLGETGLLSLGAGLLAVAVTQASLPYLNRLLDKKITFDLFQSPELAGGLLAGIILTALFAGFYPAWLISTFNPVASLKTGWTTAAAPKSAGNGGAWLRKVLVVTQFSLSVAMFIAVALIARQVHYLRSKNLGFDKDNVVNVPIPFSPRNSKAPVFAAELSKIPQLKDFSFATATPSSDDHWGTAMSLSDRDDPNRREMTLILADDRYCPVYGMQLLAGRVNVPSDTNAVSSRVPAEQRVLKSVVNKRLVEELQLGSPEAAVGKRFWCGFWVGKVEIVGVVADFNTGSLREAVKPTLITQMRNFYSQASIRIGAGSDVPETLAAIESAWKKAVPDGVYEFEFLDEQIDAYYKAEMRLYSLFKIFAGLAMLISCLGLWGLATFAARQRTKEIGVRKVLGASAAGIAALLSIEFLKLVGIATCIASLLAYMGMKRWLEDFAYRIDIGWQVFVLAGFGAAIIALLTVGFQSVKAALANPVRALRSE